MALARSTEVQGAPAPSDEAALTGGSSALRVLALAIAAIAAFAVVAADWDSPIRTVLALGFLLFVPGLAVAELLEIRDPVQRLAIATGASLAIETLVGIVLLYAGVFSAEAVAGVVYGLTCAALLASVRRHGLHADGGRPDGEPRSTAT